KSGVALKRSTVENGGVYPIVSRENGASLATRLVVASLLTSGKIKDPMAKIDPKVFMETMNSPAFVPVTGLINKALGEEWKNFGKLRSCLNREVGGGHITAFKVSEDIEPFLKDIDADLKKILNPVAAAPKKPAAKK